ncbi:MAG TPA: PAS domain S-box protein [Bryobacteraceae bacterium]|nr:PAS domain S-box protein [Bryobacteraceae bacterium]
MPLRASVQNAGRERPWIGYAFAVTICVLAFVVEFFLDRASQGPVYPFLTAFMAVIASAAWGGAGPGLLATALLTGWSAYDLSNHDVAFSDTLVRCLVFLVEGVLLSFGSSRMWGSMRKAALSESWHRQLVETAGEGIWVHDDDSVITWANPRMGEMLGIAVETLIGRKVEEFFAPADLSMERIRAANLRNGRKEQFDRRLRREDGQEIWVLTCSNYLAGDMPRALAMMTDITERKRAEYALRRSEERFRNLFEGVLEGVYQSTPDGRILAANPMLLRMLGLHREAEMNDVNIAKDLYVNPHIRQRLLEQLEREGGFQNVEYELRRRDGAVITVLENARVVRDENGAVLYYEGTLTDITPRKRMEEQLRQAQKVEALGRLAGGVAHDFNNVLTIISGFGQLALSDLAAAHPARSSVEQVLQASDRAMALTRQLLSFSRRQTPAEESLDLNHLVERCGVSREPGVVLSLCPETLPVFASAKEVEPIIRALSAQARRTFPSASLELRTELANAEEEFCLRSPGVQPGMFAVLSIFNQQMEPDREASPAAGGARAGIAELLARPGFAAMRAGESAAIGLSATHATVTHCGGFLAGQRAASQGRAYLSLHAFLPCASAPLNAAPGVIAEPAGETILLVEDEPLVRELSRDMLERQGYRVVLASNAKEAEQISGSAGSFDLLITDAVMPSMSGPELARRLRTSHPGLKVLLISGYTDDPPGRDDPAADGAAFLQKPFSADSLGRKIRQMLSRQ